MRAHSRSLSVVRSQCLNSAIYLSNATFLVRTLYLRPPLCCRSIILSRLFPLKSLFFTRDFFFARWLNFPPLSVFPHCFSLHSLDPYAHLHLSPRLLLEPPLQLLISIVTHRSLFSHTLKPTHRPRLDRFAACAPQGDGGRRHCRCPRHRCICRSHRPYSTRGRCLRWVERAGCLRQPSWPITRSMTDRFSPA